VADVPRRPTRDDLLVIVARLQGHLSAATSHALNENQDPAPLRAELELGMNLCFDALGQDAPVNPTRGPWGARPTLRDGVLIAPDGSIVVEHRGPSLTFFLNKPREARGRK
jgi:hypothetical protein